MTPEKLVEELDRIVQVPGLSNIWVPPIRNRIDMLATGIKSPVGIKVSGPTSPRSTASRAEIERVVKDGAGRDLGARRAADRRALHRRRRSTAHAAARYGLNIADVQSDRRRGDRRREHRRDGRGPAALSDQRALSARGARLARGAARRCRSSTERGAQIALGDVATIAITDGPPMLRSENARLSGWVYVDIRGRDLASAVRDMQRAVAERGEAPAGLLGVVVGPVRVPGARDAAARRSSCRPRSRSSSCCSTSTFRRVDEALLIMATLPFALVGGVLAAVAARPQHVGRERRSASSRSPASRPSSAWSCCSTSSTRWERAARARDAATADAARRDRRRRGAARAAEGDDGRGDHRRPAADHVVGSGTGSEVMQRIAAPMVGGMITAPLLSMFVIPAAYYLIAAPVALPRVRRRAHGGGRPVRLTRRDCLPSDPARRRRSPDA